MRRALAVATAALIIAVVIYYAYALRHPGHWYVQVGTNMAGKAPVALTEEPSHHLALSNDYVRVFRVEAAPHATTLIHRHDNDYVWISLGPSDIINSVTGQKPTPAHIEDGEVRFAAGGFAHSVTNTA